MPMPTTRRGRYEYYRERALRRLRKLRRGKAIDTTTPGIWCKSITKRQWDFRLWGKQATATGYSPYPIHTHPSHPEFFWRVVPHRGQPPVPFHGAAWARFLARGYHYDRALDNVFKRRVMSVPRFSRIPLKNWAAAVEEIPDEEFYPFEFYPSGRPGYLWHRDL